MGKAQNEYPLTWGEIEYRSEPIKIGLCSSSMTIEYGCGHIVYRTNGDPVHHTCPYCYVERKEDG